jgi:DsbC/DsbD-like thiol-disulfide interchange protein
MVRDMNPIALLAATLALLPVAAPAPAPAENRGALRPEEAVRVELLPGWRQADGSHMAAVRVTLAPGWKTYWRAPGETGIPPRFDWRASRNVAAVQTHWPRPTVFDADSIRSIGYTAEMVLPLRIVPDRPGQAMALSGTMELGICEDICVPVSVSLGAALPSAGGRDGAIARALASEPRRAAQPARCTVTPIRDGLRVSAEIALPRLPGGPEHAVMELPDPEVWSTPPELARQGDRLRVTGDLLSYARGGILFDRSALKITIIGARDAVEVMGCTAG